MHGLDHILQPTDFSSCAASAFVHAVRLARRNNATLHLFNVAPSMEEGTLRGRYGKPIESTEYFKQIEEEADAEMQRLIDAADTDGVSIRRVHTRGIAPGPVIVDYAESEAIDLVVMGTSGRRGVRRFVLGSVAEEVVRHAPCSVFTVRSEEGIEEEPAHIQRILIPVDLSAYTRPLLNVGYDVAEEYSAAVDVLHVVESSPFPSRLVGAFTLSDVISDPERRAKDQLDHLVEEMQPTEIPAQTHIRDGHAAASIVETARENDVDLIVIASRGRSGFEGFLLGSVTERVVRKADCPVFIARVEPEEAGQQEATEDN